MPKEIEYNNADPTKKTFIVVDKMQEEFEKQKGIYHGGCSTHLIVFTSGYHAGLKSADLLPTEKVCPKCGGDGSRCYAIADLDSYATCETCNGNGTIPIYYTPEQYERITGKSYPDDAYIHYGVYLTNTVISRNPEVCEESNFSWRQPVPYENHKNHKNVVIVQTAQPAPDADYRPEE